MFDLSGRAAIVTGGSGALGRAIALGLRSAGANVALLARHPAMLDEVVASLAPGLPAEAEISGEPEMPGEAVALVADVLDGVKFKDGIKVTEDNTHDDNEKTDERVAA